MEQKFDIKELEKQCLEAEKNFKTLHEQLTKVKKEEEEMRQAKLTAEKDARYQEIVDAKEHYYELVRAYINDYGAITIKNDSSELESIFGSKPWHWWF